MLVSSAGVFYFDLTDKGTGLFIIGILAFLWPLVVALLIILSPIWLGILSGYLIAITLKARKPKRTTRIYADHKNDTNG